MFARRLAFALAALTALFVTAKPAQAATLDLIVEGGGVQQVYRLENGNLLGLWGFDTRNSRTTGGTFTTADITAYFRRGAGDIVGYYYGSNSTFNGAAQEFDPITGPITLANGQRVFDAIWIEWERGALVFNAIGRSRSMNPGNITRSGDPFAAAAVPLPAGLWMAFAAFGGLLVVGRRRRA